MAGIAAMADYARKLIDVRRRQLGDDLLSRLLIVSGEEEGQLTEDEVVVTMMTLILGGYESTATTIGTALLALFRRPDQLAVLRADPGKLVPAVEELLRYALLDNGFGSPRITTADITIGDVRVPAGSTLLIVRRSANRDETRFPDPDDLNLARDGAHHHLTFGAGTHFCLGAPLARLELQVALATVLARLPNIRLAVAVEELEWQVRFAASGPKTLPVTWG
jgi:cytochrome P450